MTKEHLEDETYSVIFTSLKHPVRRKILRMLAKKALTFSEILEVLSIDSGHLSYHLEALGELIVHVQDGKYQLSSIGLAAVKLMGGVEEQSPNSSKKSKQRHQITVIFPVLMALALFVASFYIATFTVPLPAVTLNGAQGDHTPQVLTIPAGETSEIKISLVRWMAPFPVGSDYGGTYLFYSDAWNFLVPSVGNSQDFGDEVWLWLDLQPNASTSSQLSALPIQLFKPDGSAATTRPQTGNSQVNDSINPWVWSGGGHFVSLPIQASEFGNYTVVITNNGQLDWAGTITPFVQWQQMEKPYFYYGVAGVVIASLGLIFGVIELRRARNNAKQIVITLC